RCPFAGPAASRTIHLVAGVLGKLHDEAVAAQPQRLDTGVDQRLGQFGPLFGRAAVPYVAWDQGRRSGSPTPQHPTRPSPSSRNATVTSSGGVCMIRA